LTTIASMNTATYTRSSGRLSHSVMSASTASVILEIVSFDTCAPYTSARCTVISPVVNPLPEFRSVRPETRALSRKDL
jgi:hypothetical protein